MGPVMQKISIPYAYNIGKLVQPLYAIVPNTSLGDNRQVLTAAQHAIFQLVYGSVYSPVLVSSPIKAYVFLEVVRGLVEDPDDTRLMDFPTLWAVHQALQDFETAFSAEMEVGAVFLVTPKRGYNIRDLVDQGEITFPLELTTKVPEAVKDLRAAARCIAFELPTAAAFHLHRVNESVLLKYWNAVTKGAPLPENRNIGQYLTGLKKRKKGSPKVKAALRDLKDLHRNPVLHPEDTLETIDEAIALLNHVHTVVVHMLKAIP